MAVAADGSSLGDLFIALVEQALRRSHVSRETTTPQTADLRHP
jgi:hypothetical protein